MRKGRFRFAILLKSDNPSTRLSFAPLSSDYDYKKSGSHFELTYRSRPNEQIFDQGITPTPGVYVQVVDGKITYGGKRLKLWGVCRHDSENLFTADRVRKLGFNAIRIWGPRDVGWYGDDESMKKEVIPQSDAVDRFDRFFAECKNLGLFIMFPAFHYKKTSKALFDDSSILHHAGAGDGDWEAWKQAMVEYKKEGLNNDWLQYFDERSREYSERHIGNILAHVNPYTGKV